MKHVVSFALILSLLLPLSAHAAAPSLQPTPEITAPAAVLMEKETGTVIYEKKAHEPGFPASITKIMTMLLIVEAIENGSLSLEDTVIASERAASFGGSCVYLEPGEQMSVHEMLKCIAVVSANDCAVAMAEQLCGSEEGFVKLMNSRAKELGMENTHFVNCTGLFDDDAHYTTAYDVALMSRELISHELIKDYSTIWMDSIRGGEFELSNTNKLVYWYPGCTGLKTGYTSTSRYCLSATAERNGDEYIAVIMHSETPEKRNSEAEALLDYAFAVCRVIDLNDGSELPLLPVEMGNKSHVQLEYGGKQRALMPKGAEPEYELELEKSVKAPVKKGTELGKVKVTINGEQVAESPVIAAEDIERIGFFGIFIKLAGSLVGL